MYKNKKLLIINDSKSTSFSSSINLLKSYKNIYWLVGGKFKKGDLVSDHRQRIGVVLSSFVSEFGNFYNVLIDGEVFVLSEEDLVKCD